MAKKKRIRKKRQEEQKGLVQPRRQTAEAIARALAQLPVNETAQWLRQTAVLHMQQQGGNRHTLQALGQGAGHALGVQLDEEPTLDPDAPLSTEGLAIEDRALPGHGDLGPVAAVQRQNGAPPPAAPARPAATINLTVNPPQIARLPEATIAANHGRANVAGWTTPVYNIQPAARTANSVTLNVTLDFRIELATEFTDGRLDILRDHEQAHVIIGERVARRHLVNGLDKGLEALPNFSSIPPMQAAIRKAVNNFVRDEGAESQAYDTADYPRMREAYFGLRAPLPDLAAASPTIQEMVDATNDFIGHASAINSSEPENPDLLRLAAAMRQARINLSQTDLPRLQYNPEFKLMIESCRGMLNVLVDSVAEAERPFLVDLLLILDSFEWQAAP